MPTTNQLRDIRTFPALVKYLESELEWPIDADSFEALTFEYLPAELGLKDADAVKIKRIHQLRPLATGQPWGIFFVEFEKKRLPVVVLRCILSHLVVKKRQSANKSDQAVWNPEDLLFISAFGDETTSQREIAFAHFHQEPGDLPTLRVLGWDGDDTPLKLDYVASQLSEKLHWPANPKDQNGWRTQWRTPFRHRIGHIIRTADSLAEVLAALARGIRDNCKIKMRAESEHGPLTKLYKGFQTALIHDLKPDDFADTYAQTITYGLLTAAISRTEMSGGPQGTVLYAENVTDMVPVTNPFLKEMLQTFLKVGGRKGGIDFDELGIQDVVELLRGEETDLPAILRDFGNKTRGEDPVIHFYEHFLSAYNKELKIKRGVFYTPQPVVSYIVRSVHELLQTEFGLEDGLASTVTWSEMLAKNPSLKLPSRSGDPGEKATIAPGEMFVQILDPATGTATFLVEVIEVIHRTLKGKWEKVGIKAMPKLPPTSFPRQPEAFGEYWNQYVPLALLPRLHGYELMMAPYAIAHMKIGLKLHETGYHFGTEERARIYLTNALEPKVTQLPQIGFDALAHEAAAVNEIKWYKRFTVVIGNPPYSLLSANLEPHHRAMVEDYKFVNGERIHERGALQLEKNLNDDYVKFVRLTQLTVEKTGIGISGLITNHSYLDNPTMRGVRWSLLNSCSRIWLNDLHGNSTKQEQSPNGGEDANVFQIKQGVAIAFCVRLPGGRGSCEAKHHELWGARQSKESWLASNSVGSHAWQRLEPTPANYLFVPQDSFLKSEFESWPSLPELMPINGAGYITARDNLVIDFVRDVLIERVQKFNSSKLSDEALLQAFDVADKKGWDARQARADLKRIDIPKRTIKTNYRPFDTRWIFFDSALVWGRSWPTMQHVVGYSRNLTMLATRMTKDQWDVWVARTVSSHKAMSAYDTNSVFPLFLDEDSESSQQSLARDHRINISLSFLKSLAGALKLQQKGAHRLPDGLTPEDIFHYAYGVFHSPSYRSRYAEFLKMDFPRLPLTGSLELFRALARLGCELVALHLLESPKLEKLITEYVGGRGPEVEKISWSKNTVWLDKAQTIGFRGVREEVWNFHIGGYQVCEKWLKDRKGRTLSAEDREHYQKIVVALSETIRLMAEIDKVIEKHGGWPLK